MFNFTLHMHFPTTGKIGTASFFSFLFVKRLPGGQIAHSSLVRGLLARVDDGSHRLWGRAAVPGRSLLPTAEQWLADPIRMTTANA